MYVFDLPFYTKEECTDFANKLCSTLGISLENGIDGVPPAGVDDTSCRTCNEIQEGNQYTT